MVFGLGQLGCIPATIARNNATQCVTEINQAVELFDTQVRSLVDDFNANLPGARFTFVNITAIQTANPLPPGIYIYIYMPTNIRVCSLYFMLK